MSAARDGSEARRPRRGREADAGLLVALETSGPVGSVALGRGGRSLARVFLSGESTHAARLVPALDALLEDAGAVRRDVGGVVVGSGPGSFTGVRVAAATAKGLVHALEVPLWAVSSLEAAAVADRLPSAARGPWEGSTDPQSAYGEGKPGDAPEASAADARPRGGADAPPPGGAGTGGTEAPTGGVRYVLFDARADRVYAACYRVATHGLQVVREPRATRLGAVLAEAWPRGTRFVGDGALRHREAIAAADGSVLPPPAGMPTADGLLHVLALRSGAAPLADPRSWEPDYLRESGAERARKR